MMWRLGLSTVALVVAAWPAAAQVPSEDELWGLRMIRLDPALERGLTGRGTTIGVVDSAMQLDHPEYAGRVGPSFDIYLQGPSTTTPDLHGTHVAGTIAGTNTGVARGATLVPITIFHGSSGGDGFDALLASGYRHGLEQGVRIFNNSWGSYGTSIVAVRRSDIEAFAPGTLAAFRQVAGAGRIMVFATGNEGFANPSIQAGMPHYFPELTPYWVAVTAIGLDGNRAAYANACGVAAQWCLAAPGGDMPIDPGIGSSAPGNGYAFIDGTSMATPHVSGALALAAELFPNATSPELVQLVLQTSRDAGAPGVDSVYGWGVLDVRNIVDTRDERVARAFASASFSRDAALGHAGALLRGQLDRRAAVRGDLSGSDLERYASFAASMDGGRIGIVDPALRAIWVAPLYGEARLDGAAGAPGASTRTGGLMAGADIVAEERLRLGLAAGWSRTQTTIPGSTDKGETDALHVGAYGALEADGWFLKGSAQVAFFSGPPGSGSVTRRDIPGAAGTAGAPVGRTNIEGTGAEIDGRIGYAFEIADGASLAPYVAVRSRWQQTGAARELDAGIFALDVAAASRHQTEFGPGLRLVSGPLVFRDVTLRLSGDIAYARLTGDAAHRSRVVLLGTAMEARTADVGRDILRVGGRLDIARTDGRITSFIGYDAAFQARAVSHTVSGGLAGSF